jgi:acyl-CoA synthetase (AMP-forming)/AMP-acid ligase II
MDFAHLTLPHIVAKRAEQQPSRIGINYTEDGLTDTIERTYFDIAARARAVALRLIEQGLEPGSRALLIYPPGLDFLDGFLGCLFACVIPVPVYPPRRHGESERFVKLMQSADPSVVLTIGVTHARYKKAALGTDNLPWIETDSATPSMDIFPPREARFDDIALLQYTSGSTGSPKGVQITHANLTSNAIGIKNCFELDESSWCCGWLPLYHDMGLIGNLLEPLFCGFPTTLMAPLNFIQQPMRWLRAISRTRASIAGGPSFGYDLCLRRVSEGERAELDLSCWKVAYNGSERINMSVLERFAAFFEVCGFERTTFLPCYGLAEATLMVTGIA